MNRLARWTMRLYPSRWRRRYSEEVHALVDDSGADARVVADLFKGAVAMQFSTWSFPRLAAVLGLAGMLFGMLASLLAPTQYVARVELQLAGANSAVTTLQMLRQQVANRVSLGNIINDRRLLLYRDQLRTDPLEDVVVRMRSDIAMDLDGAAGIAISFRYPDPTKAERTAQVLAEKSIEALGTLASVDRRAGPQPPFLYVVDTASQPHRPLRPNPARTALVGLIAGLILALVWRILTRLRGAARRSKRLSRTAATLAIGGTIAGALLAWAIPPFFWYIPEPMLPAWAIPLTWQSNATMYADDGAAAPLSSLVTQISSRTSMASIIANPRPRLYADELKRNRLEDVAEMMRRDVAITIRGTGAGGRWIDISFRYSDPLECQQTVQMILSRLSEEYRNSVGKLIPSPRRLVNLGTATVRSAGNAPLVSVESVTQNRAPPILSGLLAGLLFATLIATLRHRWTADEEEISAPRPVATKKFDAAGFRKKALWLTATGVVAGAVVTLLTPVRYASDALLSFDNAYPSRAAILINDATNRGWRQIVIDHGLDGVKPNQPTDDADFTARLTRARRGLTWRQEEVAGSGPDAFRIQFISDEAKQAQSVLGDVVGEIDRALGKLHGGGEAPFEEIRGVDGALLPGMSDSGGSFEVLDGVGLQTQPITPQATPVAIPFDDQRAKPVPQQEYRAVRMNVIDMPSLPSGPEGIGWWVAAIGGAAGLSLAALITLFAGLFTARNAVVAETLPRLS